MSTADRVTNGKLDKQIEDALSTAFDDRELAKEMLIQYLKNGGDPNYKKNGGSCGSAVHRACEYAFGDGLLLLAYAGADLEVQDVYGDTPLHSCMYFPFQEYTQCMFFLITAGVDVYIKNQNGVSPHDYYNSPESTETQKHNYFAALQVKHLLSINKGVDEKEGPTVVVNTSMMMIPHGWCGKYTADINRLRVGRASLLGK